MKVKKIKCRLLQFLFGSLRVYCIFSAIQDERKAAKIAKKKAEKAENAAKVKEKKGKATTPKPKKAVDQHTPQAKYKKEWNRADSL